eukprot:TRINITY_DN48170_c0_g3_i1.p2 TRINITY_DN48170_c0_g3~~TRINITY_DN48170_c0_g3_i1.p2  ORF type:complete len:124 (-),score=2.05 TRINITY_DN48170_c0_g3_i1:59-430(-)
MGDGWETKRSRVPNHIDWVIIRLGDVASSLKRAEIDTCHFKGNFPDFCLLEATAAGTEEEALKPDNKWVPITEKLPLAAHEIHHVALTCPLKRVLFVRFTIFPDGGVSRLRLFGTRAATKPSL